jgi:molecular chaperone GrpE
VSDEDVENDIVSAFQDVDPDVVDPDVVEPLSDVERERNEYLDTLQRVQAEFENYRKRIAKTSENAAVRAAGGIVVTLLPVLDALDLAQTHFEDSTSDEAAALTQSRTLLLETLRKDGLERIDAVGVGFDPQVHDAVAHIEGDGEQIIDEVLRAGYLWKGAVLRPAMVRVKG